MRDINYRPDLPPVPNKLRQLPIQRGYPVPWFVAEVNGVYDFRIADSDKLALAIEENRCWLCGSKLGSHVVFTIGLMCSINRISAEPPSHLECAEFGVKACPFLNQTQAKRRENDLPDMLAEPPGVFLQRQPEVILTWVTKKYSFFEDNGGILFNLGNPYSVKWWHEGRKATKEEIMAAFELGYPSLHEMAVSEGQIAVWEIESGYKKALELIPDDSEKKTIFGSAVKKNV
jgi:hypothetical protein